MEYTGERLIPGRKGLELLELEHRARYELAEPSARGRRVLDLGCGTGYGSSRLAEIAERVVGVDLSLESVEYARGAFGRSNLSFETGDVTDDSLVETLRRIHPEPFDLVVCFEVLEHVSRPVEVLSRIKRLLAPTGLLFISTPNISRPHTAVERDNPFHVVEYGEDELVRVLGAEFASVRLFRQSVHLVTRIADSEEERGRSTAWQDSTPDDAKYFVAVCSDRPADEVESLILTTSDIHLMLLQERLSDLRKDQHQRGQTIERLRERVTSLEEEHQIRELIERQERTVADLVRGQSRSADDLLGGAIRLLQDGEAQPESGDADVPASLTQLADLAGHLRRDRDAAASESDGLRAALAEIEAERGREQARRRQLEQEIEDRERRLAAHEEKVHALQRLVEARTAAGIELSERLEAQRRLLASGAAETEAVRARLREVQDDKRRLENEIRSAAPRPVADPSFVRYFADLSARLDERVGSLQRRNAELESQSAGLIDEIEPPRAVVAERGSDDPPTVNDLHRELQTWRGLARDLATELHHILTSRRWRFVMRVVRLRNFLLGVPEGDPIAGHLNFHLRRAGQEPTRFDLRTADARTLRRRFSWARAFRSEPRMDLLSKREKAEAIRALLNQGQELLVSVIMPTWNRGDQIAEAIASVRDQSFRHWELLVVDDGSTDTTTEVIEKLCQEDPRIRLLPMPHRGVSAARDAGLRAAKGELIAYLDSDNKWDPHYLLFMVNAIVNSRGTCAYSALRVIDHDESQAESVRRRRFDFGALLKNNYIDINVFVHRAELFQELGGFDPELRRWVDWDLILRYVRHHPPEEVPVLLCDYKREKRSLQITHEEPGSYKFKVLNKHLIDWEALRRSLRHRKPGMTSIVIPNFDLPEMTRECVDSILDAGGPELEILVVDNGSSTKNRRKLHDLLDELDNVYVIETYENYGFALGCNVGAAASRGEVVVWLNNDTRVHRGWLQALLRPLHEDSSVGIVGPKLLWPDGTLQHGGMVFGPQTKIPYHVYQGFPGEHPAVNKSRRFQALSGACLAIRASDFVELTGFDPIYLNGCEDLDLCFRVRTLLDKEVVYNPASVVTHYEGKTPGRSKNIQFNRTTFVSRWRDQIEPDDESYFEDDGFEVEEYVKKGAERHSETALYHPVLKRRQAGAGSRQPTDGPDPLRVGFVSIWYERGVSYVTRQLANTLEQTEGFETHVFARWESDQFRNAGSIFHPRVVNAGDDPSPADIVAWARDRRLDLVVFVEIHPNDWKRIAALKGAGFKVLCYEHLDILRMDMLDRYADVDGFLANSFFTWNAWRAEYPDKPALALPWGIAPELVRANLDRRPSKRLRFVHIGGWGGLNNRKNTSLCIEAFHEAAPRGSSLTVYSQSPLERYGDVCADIVRRDRSIQVHEGTVDYIWKIYQTADVLLWPSKREGLGLPILEALASGLPALISDGYMMKEWPVLGAHASVCRVLEGEAEDEAVQRYLPLLKVDRHDLVDRIRALDASPDEVAAMRANVRRDRSRWLWTWQSVSLALELRRFVANGEFHPDPASYIPSYMLEFERLRAASRAEEAAVASEDADPLPIASKTPRPRAPRFLFIAGCQRSGTTALLQLLNEDERFAIGRERFKQRRTEITPEWFRENRFFDPERSETNYRVPEFYERLRERWRSGTVTYIGDKVPFYYKNLPYLAETFPGSKILFLIRDLEGVAASYNARAQNPEDYVWKPTMDYRRAVEDWNESLARLDEFLRAGHRDRVFVVHYERFFSGAEGYLEALFEFLQLPVTPSVRAEFRAMTCEWSARAARPNTLSVEMVEHLAERRDRRLENRCLALCTVSGGEFAAAEAP